MESECIIWLNEVREVFPGLDKKIILTEYKKIVGRGLGYVKARIGQEINFNAEAFILGTNSKIRKKRAMPKEFYIYINNKLQEIKNPELRREIAQFIMIHELLHIEQKDLITLSKQYSRRKKKKIHINSFENEVFERYNQLRERKNLPRIKEESQLKLAISKILDSINFNKK